MTRTKRRVLVQLPCCCLLTIGLTICFWMLEPPSFPAVIMLALIYIIYSIAECIFIGKRCNFQQTALSLAPQKLLALIVSMLLCKQLHALSGPAPRINFDAIVFLFVFYVPFFIVPALFAVLKKGIEEKTNWGKLFFWGNLAVLCASWLLSIVIAGLFASIFWKGY